MVVAALTETPSICPAAIVLVAVAVLIGLIALSRRSGPLDANKQEQINRDSERSPGIAPTPAPSVEDSTKVALLKDAGGEVTIDRDGRITGLDEVSESSRQYVARAALSEQIVPSDVLRRLSGEPGGLRGNNDGQQGFTPSSMADSGSMISSRCFRLSNISFDDSLLIRHNISNADYFFLAGP